MKRALLLCLCLLMTVGAASAETKNTIDHNGTTYASYSFTYADMMERLAQYGLQDAVRLPAAYRDGAVAPSMIYTSFLQQEDADAWPEAFPGMYLSLNAGDDKPYTLIILVGRPNAADPNASPAESWTVLEGGMTVVAGADYLDAAGEPCAVLFAMDENSAALLESGEAPPVGVLLYQLNGWAGSSAADLMEIVETM